MVIINVMRTTLSREGFPYARWRYIPSRSRRVSYNNNCNSNNDDGKSTARRRDGRYLFFLKSVVLRVEIRSSGDK